MATRLLNITDKIKNYFEPSPDGVRVRDFARELPGEVLNTVVGVGRSLASAPIRVGASLGELPLTLTGKEPFEPTNVPLLGKVSTYAREAVDTQNQMGGGPLATATGIVGAGSKAIADVSLLGGLAQKFTGETPTDLFVKTPAVPVAPKAEPWSYDRTAESIKSSEALDIEGTIRSGDMPREAFYKLPGKKILNPNFAQGRIDDVAQKLDAFKQGLGDNFRKAVDVNQSTYDGLIKKGLDILNSSIGYRPDSTTLAAVTENTNEMAARMIGQRWNKPDSVLPAAFGGSKPLFIQQ